MNEQWKTLSVIVAQSAADVVSNRCVELGSQGTVLEDVATPPEHCRVLAYYPESAKMPELMAQMQEYLNELRELGECIGEASITSDVLENCDWTSNWKQFFKPTRVGRHLVIKPSWETFTPESDDIVIEIDPGMAFGSGLHASTRLAIALLELYMRPGGLMLDVGVGSGILSIAAARLGAEFVLGVDIDPDAIEVARENVRKNAELTADRDILNVRVVLKVGSLDTLDIPKRFDCIVMNIRPNVITSLMPYAASFLRMGGAVILSGILEEEGPALLRELRALNFVPHHHITEDGWVAYVLSQV